MRVLLPWKKDREHDQQHHHPRDRQHQHQHDPSSGSLDDHDDEEDSDGDGDWWDPPSSSVERGAPLEEEVGAGTSEATAAAAPCASSFSAAPPPSPLAPLSSHSKKKRRAGEALGQGQQEEEEGGPGPFSGPPPPRVQRRQQQQQQQQQQQAQESSCSPWQEDSKPAARPEPSSVRTSRRSSAAPAASAAATRATAPAAMTAGTTGQSGVGGAPPRPSSPSSPAGASLSPSSPSPSSRRHPLHLQLRYHGGGDDDEELEPHSGGGGRRPTHALSVAPPEAAAAYENEPPRENAQRPPAAGPRGRGSPPASGGPAAALDGPGGSGDLRDGPPAPAASPPAPSSFAPAASRSYRDRDPAAGCVDEGVAYDDDDEEDDREGAFVRGLRSRGLEVVEQEGDGNCLFRAVALQVYGDASAHGDVRRLVCDFMAKDRQHFALFVDDEDFGSYIARKRMDGAHGNSPELQAVCELFNRPLEVYTPEAGPDRPINVFQDQYKTGDAPIRLSYHDRNHYNAVVDPLEPTAGLGLGLPGLRPGLADKLQLGRAKAESDAVQDEAELRRVVEESTLEYRRSADDDLQRALKESAFSMDHMYKDKALVLSDLDATNFELEQTALEDSMLAFASEQGRKQRARTTGGTPPGEAAAAAAAASSSSRSRRRGRDDEYGPSYASAYPSSPDPLPAASRVAEAPAAASAAAASAASAPSPVSHHHQPPVLLDAMEYPTAVQELVMNGFELSKVVHAYGLVGDSFDDMLTFLLSQEPRRA